MANKTQEGRCSNRRLIIPRGLLDPEQVNVVYIPRDFNASTPLLVTPPRYEDGPNGTLVLPEFYDELSQERPRHFEARPRGCLSESSVRTRPSDRTVGFNMAVPDAANRPLPQPQPPLTGRETVGEICRTAPSPGQPALVHAEATTVTRADQGPVRSRTLTVDAPEGIDATTMGAILRNQSCVGQQQRRTVAHPEEGQLSSLYDSSQYDNDDWSSPMGALGGFGQDDGRYNIIQAMTPSPPRAIPKLPEYRGERGFRPRFLSTPPQDTRTYMSVGSSEPSTLYSQDWLTHESGMSAGTFGGSSSPCAPCQSATNRTLGSISRQEASPGQPRTVRSQNLVSPRNVTYAHHSPRHTALHPASAQMDTSHAAPQISPTHDQTFAGDVYSHTPSHQYQSGFCPPTCGTYAGPPQTSMHPAAAPMDSAYAASQRSTHHDQTFSGKYTGGVSSYTPSHQYASPHQTSMHPAAAPMDATQAAPSRSPHPDQTIFGNYSGGVSSYTPSHQYASPPQTSMHTSGVPMGATYASPSRSPHRDQTFSGSAAPSHHNQSGSCPPTCGGNITGQGSPMEAPVLYASHSGGRPLPVSDHFINQTYPPRGQNYLQVPQLQRHGHHTPQMDLRSYGLEDSGLGSCEPRCTEVCSQSNLQLNASYPQTKPRHTPINQDQPISRSHHDQMFSPPQASSFHGSASPHPPSQQPISDHRLNMTYPSSGQRRPERQRHGVHSPRADLRSYGLNDSCEPECTEVCTDPSQRANMTYPQTRQRHAANAVPVGMQQEHALSQSRSYHHQTFSPHQTPSFPESASPHTPVQHWDSPPYIPPLRFTRDRYEASCAPTCSSFSSTWDGLDYHGNFSDIEPITPSVLFPSYSDGSTHAPPRHRMHAPRDDLRGYGLDDSFHPNLSLNATYPPTRPRQRQENRSLRTPDFSIPDQGTLCEETRCTNPCSYGGTPTRHGTPQQRAELHRPGFHSPRADLRGYGLNDSCEPACSEVCSHPNMTLNATYPPTRPTQRQANQSLCEETRCTDLCSQEGSPTWNNPHQARLANYTGSESGLESFESRLATMGSEECDPGCSSARSYFST